MTKRRRQFSSEFKAEVVDLVLRQRMRDKRTEHKRYIGVHGQDMPEIREWQWPNANGDIS